MSNKNKVSLHVPIAMLSYSWKGEFQDLPANQVYKLTIDYPLETPVVYDIKTGIKGMSFISLLQKIGKCYDKTYKKEDEDPSYGIYGHDIGDLNLSEIIVNHDKKTIKLGVDS